MSFSDILDVILDIFGGKKATDKFLTDIRPGRNIGGRASAQPQKPAFTLAVDNSSPGPMLTKSHTTPSGGSAQDLLDFIAKHESGGDYNVAWGGKKYDLENMNLSEVLTLQKEMKNSGAKSTALGRYQFINSTLSELKDKLKLKGDEKFDRGLQDRLATELLKRRGYEDFLSGNIDSTRFMRNLSKEWASLPKDKSGKSYYAGDGLNKALTDPKSVLDLLSKLRES